MGKGKRSPLPVSEDGHELGYSYKTNMRAFDGREDRREHKETRLYWFPIEDTLLPYAGKVSYRLFRRGGKLVSLPAVCFYAYSRKSAKTDFRQWEEERKAERDNKPVLRLDLRSPVQREQDRKAERREGRKLLRAEKQNLQEERYLIRLSQLETAEEVSERLERADRFPADVREERVRTLKIRLFELTNEPLRFGK